MERFRNVLIAIHLFIFRYELQKLDSTRNDPVAARESLDALQRCIGNNLRTLRERLQRSTPRLLPKISSKLHDDTVEAVDFIGEFLRNHMSESNDRKRIIATLSDVKKVEQIAGSEANLMKLFHLVEIAREDRLSRYAGNLEKIEVITKLVPDLLPFRDVIERNDYGKLHDLIRAIESVEDDYNYYVLRTRNHLVEFIDEKLQDDIQTNVQRSNNGGISQHSIYLIVCELIKGIERSNGNACYYLLDFEVVKRLYDYIIRKESDRSWSSSEDNMIYTGNAAEVIRIVRDYYEEKARGDDIVTSGTVEAFMKPVDNATKESEEYDEPACNRLCYNTYYAAIYTFMARFRFIGIDPFPILQTFEGYLSLLHAISVIRKNIVYSFGIGDDTIAYLNEAYRIALSNLGCFYAAFNQ